MQHSWKLFVLQECWVFCFCKCFLFSFISYYVLCGSYHRKKKDKKGASFSVKLVSVNKLWYPEIHIQYWNKICCKVKTANRHWGASKKELQNKAIIKKIMNCFSSKVCPNYVFSNYWNPWKRTSDVVYFLNKSIETFNYAKINLLAALFHGIGITNIFKRSFF